MLRTALKILILDAVLLLAEFEMLQDEQNRIQCALGSPLYGHACMVRTSPSFSYSLLTRSFSMFVDGKYVQSPPTFDWVQLIAYVLVAVNAWFVYTAFFKRKLFKTAQGSAQPSVAEQ